MAWGIKSIKASTPRRLQPDWAFPAYIFTPGENPHPKKSGGHMEGEGDPVCLPIDPSVPEQHLSLRYALDLYNHGYFWESHVYFEAIWNAHGRHGPEADLMKAFIKLGAAWIKLKLGQPESARGHFARARELMESIFEQGHRQLLGWNLTHLGGLTKELEEGSSEFFYLLPDWD
jgi:uncharacterized protein